MTVPGSKIYAGCACIGLFHRLTQKIVEEYKSKVLEIIAGKSLLDALTEFEFPEKEPENTIRLKALLSALP